jgi:prenylcysteine oxidase/farnesylcysteine lyase
MSSLHTLTSRKYYVEQESINALFVDEIIGAATRVNYGQDPSSLHALEGLVSLATGGAASVAGGNRLIFENFAKRSGADVRLRSRVKLLAKLDEEGAGWLVQLEDGSRETFHSVVIAAPFHQSGIRLYGNSKNGDDDDDIGKRVPEQRYVNLHVTLLVTNATAPRGEFFRGRKGSLAPRTVYSTFERADRQRGHHRPKLNSLNYLRRAGDGKWVVKRESDSNYICPFSDPLAWTVFSENELQDSLLEEIFGQHNLLWVNRKAWYAYPGASCRLSQLLHALTHWKLINL